MKRPGFNEGVLFALLAGVVSSAVMFVFAGLIAGGVIGRLLITSIGFCYVLYLLNRSQTRVGWLTVTALWWAVAGLCWISAPSLTIYALVHIGMIWMIRCLYFHAGLLTALADMVLIALSVVLAMWAGIRTDSLFMGVWCFFLLQALFVFIPALRSTPNDNALTRQVNNNGFDKAYRNAEVALRKFTSSR